jgi:phage antirepressor YoqD-like protein
MNSIVTLNDTGLPVTTSLAIAEGVERPHASIIKLIRENLSDFEAFGLVGFEIQPRSAGQHGGGETEYAVLNEHHATLLITFLRNIGIVKEFKKRLVKAFFEMRDELNRRQAPAVESLSRLEILQLAIQSEEERLRLERENEQLEHRLEEEAPRVAFAKQVEIAHDAISVAQAAKILGTGQRRLFSFLRQIGWVSRRNEPYQSKIETGYLDVKLGSWDHPNHGLQQSVTALVTGKGLAKLQRLWAEHHKEEGNAA